MCFLPVGHWQGKEIPYAVASWGGDQFRVGLSVVPKLLKQFRGSIIKLVFNAFATSNLPFDEWTETFGSERLTGARLDRLTHHVNILEMSGDSYRLGQSKARQDKP